ncbi:hypothetical protein DFJ74DRAFT_687936 [Hyaloraphidium curvatum]|nr:hypothetical protein DFJ74DRAFT_687936 [Hyaloraphidium curvatum]
MSRPGRAAKTKPVDYTEKTELDVPTRDPGAAKRTGTPAPRPAAPAAPVVLSSDLAEDLVSAPAAASTPAFAKKSAAKPASAAPGKPKSRESSVDVGAAQKRKRAVVSSDSESSDSSSSLSTSESEVSPKPKKKTPAKVPAAGKQDRGANKDSSGSREKATAEPSSAAVRKTDNEAENVSPARKASNPKDVEGGATDGNTASASASASTPGGGKPKAAPKAKSSTTKAGKGGAGKGGSAAPQSAKQSLAPAADPGASSADSAAPKRSKALIDVAPPVAVGVKAVPLTGKLVPKSGPPKLPTQPAMRVGLSRKSLGKSSLHSYLSKKE